MSEQSADELRGLLAGTWIGIACLAELLAERGILPRSELTSLLASSEARADDQHRRSGIAGLRRLIESGLGRDPLFLGRAPSREVINRIFDEAEARAAQEAKARAELAAHNQALQFRPRDKDHFDDRPIPSLIKKAG
jgi:hypothetical protein